MSLQDHHKNQQAANDYFTVAAIASVATCATFTIHEGTHAVVALLLGHRVHFFSAVFVHCDIDGGWMLRVFNASASLINLVVAAVLLRLLRSGISLSEASRYFLWILMLLNGLAGAGYWMFSGFSNFGDWAIVIRGLSPHWFWRSLLIIGGSVAYMGVIFVSLRALGRFIGGDPSEQFMRATKLTVTSYAAVVAVIAATAFCYPDGPINNIMLAAILATVCGNSPLLWMPQWLRADYFAKEPGPAFTVPRSSGWIVASLVVAAFFALVLGRGISF